MTTWQKYRESKKFRLDLTAIGLEGFWIDIRDLRSLTPVESEAFTAKVGEGNPSMKDAMEAVAPLILAWNVTDPETDVLLPIPKEDLLVLRKLPLDIMIYVNEEIVRRSGVPVPEVKGT